MLDNPLGPKGPAALERSLETVANVYRDRPLDTFRAERERFFLVYHGASRRTPQRLPMLDNPLGKKGPRGLGAVAETVANVYGDRPWYPWPPVARSASDFFGFIMGHPGALHMKQKDEAPVCVFFLRMDG